ncbi:fasciclin-like arabinogalactan protein 11 [Curcuma longa]|uniref:fasciclin-like arabinogalactan protein 11 n=1 Tax=Curcuma longa TaxID=136217 RepID=UPI003D9F5C4D
MAPSFLIFFFLSVSSFLLLSAPPALSQAPSPSSGGPLNLTAILVKGGQYSTFVRLLQQTRIDVQLNSQLNNSYSGITVFAPTDNAFAGLGTINNLSEQELIETVLYHVLPRYYSFATFQSASNPLPTQASDRTGVFTLNVTTAAVNAHQANISTGVVNTTFSNVLYADFPLAVYSVDKVLLPYAIFGPKPPASAPAPSTNSNRTTTPSSSDAGIAPPPASKSSNNDAGGGSSSSRRASEVGYWSLLAGVGFLGIAAGNML